MQYRMRIPKGPPFHFFLYCDFFSKKKIPQRFPLFLEFCDRMDVEKFREVAPFTFFGIETSFKEVSGAVKENTLTL